MKCSICYMDIDVQPYWDKGHNAEPVNFGRCCTKCNDNVVIPARLAQVYLGGGERKAAYAEQFEMLSASLPNALAYFYAVVNEHVGYAKAKFAADMSADDASQEIGAWVNLAEVSHRAYVTLHDAIEKFKARAALVEKNEQEVSS